MRMGGISTKHKRSSTTPHDKTLFFKLSKLEKFLNLQETTTSGWTMELNDLYKELFFADILFTGFKNKGYERGTVEPGFFNPTMNDGAHKLQLTWY